MVLSSKEPPYDKLMKAQQRTWDSIVVDGVTTVYYYGGGFLYKHHRNDCIEIGLNISDGYYQMFDKFVLALKTIEHFEFDYIFRTNSSSYVDKKRLIEFTESLPREKCYQGVTYTYSDVEYCSGAGFFISKDIALELLNTETNGLDKTFEDVTIGTIIKSKGISISGVTPRVDLSEGGDKNEKCFHYRCKTGGNRDGDIEHLEWLFKNNSKNT